MRRFGNPPNGLRGARAVDTHIKRSHERAVRDMSGERVAYQGLGMNGMGASNRVQRAADAAGTVAEDVGVDHGGADVAVAVELLDVRMSWPRSRRWVAKEWRKVWRKVWRAGHSFVEAGFARRNLDGTLLPALTCDRGQIGGQLGGVTPSFFVRARATYQRSKV